MWYVNEVFKLLKEFRRIRRGEGQQKETKANRTFKIELKFLL